MAAKNLFRHLHTGFTGNGVHRVPIGGDTTRLPFANGLTPLDKRLAWAQHYLAQHFGGTQQVRLLMGHRHFGARVVYGDCLSSLSLPTNIILLWFCGYLAFDKETLMSNSQQTWQR